MAEPECVLCTDDPCLGEERVKKFDLDKWNRVKSSADKRLKRPQGLYSKYWAVCGSLPDNLSDKCGYHSTCYNKFTALPKDTPAGDSCELKTLLRSQARDLGTTSSAGILPSVCIFCTKARKKWRGGEVSLARCELDCAEESIKDAANILHDEPMLAKIGNIGFHAKEVKYHNICKRDYLNRARSVVTKNTNADVKAGEISAHEVAFGLLISYIQSSVIDNSRPEYLVSLHFQYCQFVRRINSDENVDIVSLAPKTLSEKIMKHFGDKVMLEMSSRKQGLVLYNSNICKDEALKMAVNSSSSAEFKVLESAHILRSSLLDIMKSCPDLPASLSLDDFSKGQAEPPDLLLKFFQVLICGSHDDISQKVNRQAMSLAQDAIFCATKGIVKPSKHLCMGIGMKSLTGSRKVVDILNRLGHSVSYHVAEGIETEIACSITKKDRVIPDMLLQVSGLCTGTAFDNYDELTETLSGKDTLHDTVGICYQNKLEVPLEHSNLATEIQYVRGERQLQEDSPVIAAKRRRRHFDPQNKTIEPYKRKPSMSAFSFEVYEGDPPENLQKMQRTNLIWMLSCFLRKDTPMWRGWNSVIQHDSLPQQIIGYMENIDLPPTRLDVVQETLRIAQQVAHECGDQFAIVTYDLAIAKPALQIQAQESPKYDNVFICFGAFHIAMTYFASLGYLIDSSGASEILCNVDVLASGSVRGFISGKHFNRCKRLHPLLATALQILHFHQFTELHGDVSDEMKIVLDTFSQNPSQASLSEVLESNACKTLLDRYNKYTDSTRSGEHGKTAKFWVIYIDLVNLYLLLDYACRTNDVDLYTHAIGLMCPIFFATHRPNYARWMTRFHLQLLNMDNTHEGIRHIFEGGALSIRRTAKNFSRSAVDLTLEQTVNKDAASRQGGIAAFTQCANARKRWTLTRSFRGAVVGCLMDMTGLTVSEGISQELKPYRIKRDNTDLQAVMKSLDETMNPFQVSLPALYCLSTGRATSNDVQNDLTGVVDKGNQWYKEFLTDCQADPKRFEKPIKRRKVKNFTADALKTRISTKDQKIKEIKCTRDIFGRLLFLAATKKLDLLKVLSFPLTQVPLSLCHITGAINKTNKSALMKKLEALGTANRAPDHVDVYILDAMFFLRTLPDLPQTFGGIARLVLQRACSFSKVVHIVCDTYNQEPSIKDYEREERGNHQVMYTITGPSQQRPANFNQALLSASFKTSLLLFLRDEWASVSYVQVLEGHTVYFGVEQSCYLYRADNGNIHTEEIEGLKSAHEEADSRIIFHADFIGKLVQDRAHTVVVRSCDTDVFILLLYHEKHLNVTIWMDTGTSSHNTRRLINISELAQKLTPPVCSALPAFHAFTGCDYTAAFLRKAKVRPYQLMIKNEKYISTFSELGSSESVELQVSATLEQFVCSMYGVHRLTDVNEARFILFNKSYAPVKEDSPMDKIKSTDPCCLPPCKDVLKQKIMRANYVAHLWKSARSSHPVKFPAHGHGWRLTDNNRLDFVWFEGPQSPIKLCVEVAEDASFNNEDDDDDENMIHSVSSDEEEVDDED